MLICGEKLAGSNWIGDNDTTTERDNGLNDGVRAIDEPFTGPEYFSSFDAALLVSRVIKYMSICREWSNYINLNHRQHLFAVCWVSTTFYNYLGYE